VRIFLDAFPYEEQGKGRRGASQEVVFSPCDEMVGEERIDRRRRREI
jgi:hypothetical protein